jgi:hypothetical protein
MSIFVEMEISEVKVWGVEYKHWRYNIITLLKLS